MRFEYEGVYVDGQGSLSAMTDWSPDDYGKTVKAQTQGIHVKRDWVYLFAASKLFVLFATSSFRSSRHAVPTHRFICLLF